MQALLPERPLPLRRGFVLKYGLGSLACAVGALAIAFFGGRWALEEAEKIRQDDALWASGVTAERAFLEDGEQRSSHFVFYSYELKVEYRDAQGKTHKGETSFDSLWTEVDQKKAPVIRYDPGAPDRFVVSWAVELGGARWGSFGVSCFGLFMIVGTLGVLSWALSRQVADARRCATRSDEVLLDVLSVTDQVVNGHKSGAKIYRYRMHGAAAVEGAPTDTGGVTVSDGGGVVGEVVLAPGAGPPLFADEEGNTIVALVSPLAPGRPMVMRRDLYPFDFTPEQAVEIRERMEILRRNRFGGPDQKVA